MARASRNGTPVVLLAFANDHEHDERFLRNLDREREAIGEALRPLVEVGRIAEPEVLAKATVDDILSVLRKPQYRGQISIFHFGGHADGTRLLFEDQAGRASPGYAGGLATYLGHQQGLVLVFLNGCSTGRQATLLRDAGVKAVITTAVEIDDEIAANFARAFYTELGRGVSLKRAYDLAVAEMKLKRGDTPDGMLQGPPPSPAGLAVPSVDGEWARRLVDELAKASNDPHGAVFLAKRAGFPPEHLPAFEEPLEFWSRIVEHALKGRMNPRRLVEEAVREFPHNPRFGECLDELGASADASLMDSVTSGSGADSQAPTPRHSSDAGALPLGRPVRGGRDLAPQRRPRAETAAWPWSLSCDEELERWRLILDEALIGELQGFLCTAFEPAEFRDWLEAWLEQEGLAPDVIGPRVLSPSIEDDLDQLVAQDLLRPSFFVVLRARLPSRYHERIARFAHVFS